MTLVTDVASLSHDIRNMMSSIQLAADQLEDSTDDRTAMLARRISNAADTCVAFCRATIAAERAERPDGSMNRIFVAELIDEIVSQLEAPSGQNLSIRIDCCPKLIAQLCYASLYRVLMNLIKNAVDAAGGSGGGAVIIKAHKLSATLIIDIVDDGPGFEVKKRTDIDLQAKSMKPCENKQHGIGLPTVVSLTEQMGGMLSKVEDYFDCTAFRLSFPNCFTD